MKKRGDFEVSSWFTPTKQLSTRFFFQKPNYELNDFTRRKQLQAKGALRHSDPGDFCRAKPIRRCSPLTLAHAVVQDVRRRSAVGSEKLELPGWGNRRNARP